MPHRPAGTPGSRARGGEEAGERRLSQAAAEGVDL